MMKDTYAGLWTRILAFAFDYLIIFLYMLLLFALNALITMFFPTFFAQVFSNPVSSQITGFFLITLPVSLYFILLESSVWQATWGKQRRKLQVVDGDGKRLSLSRATMRTLLKFIPWELAHTCIWQLSFGPDNPSPLIIAGFVLVWILVGANALHLMMNQNRQSLYDKIAGTFVVKRLSENQAMS